MKKYGLLGKLKAKEGNGSQLSSILLEASRLVMKLEGCHLYMVSQDSTDEDLIWITEVWDSKEDHDNSLKIVEVRELISKAIPIVSVPPQKGIEMKVLGGIVGTD